MKCPLCQFDLVPGEQRRFETLVEHVTAPNDEPSMKQGYTCVRPYCPAEIFSLHWLDNGEGPYGEAPFSLTYLDWNDGIMFPRGTQAYQIQQEMENDRAEKVLKSA